MSVSPSRPPGVLDPRPPVAASLLALAPRHLPNRRQLRAVGDHLHVALATLAARDQAIVRHLYQALSELLAIIGDPAHDDAQKWREVARWAQPARLAKVLSDARELGLASHAPDPGEELAKAIHDVRGGPLSALLGHLQLLGRLPREDNELNTLFVLARDHLKIMRSALTGLDEARREADREPKAHAMSLLLAKWHGSVVGPTWQQQPLHMHVDCRYEGALTECCLESAAIDRIFYNLANNACRHAAGERLEMVIFPVPEVPGQSLRFVLSNEVNEADRVFLASLVGAGGADGADRGAGLSMCALFEPKVSSTGSGFGLTVVADFVADAFGLSDRREALRARYVGAVLEGRTFRVWFHWPIANDALPAKLDDYHHPQQSLSEPR